MDTVQQQLQKSRGRIGEKQQQQQQEQPPPPSPPSPSSSPSHEFSFTISLHPSAAAAAAISDKTKAPTSTFAIDLSPADDIFFHGHLLPLHLLSHLPVSPRSSTNSLDSFTLPITELLEDQKTHSHNGGSSSSSSNIISHNVIKRGCNSDNNIRGGAGAGGNGGEAKERTKSKSFSLFGRWRKGCEIGDEKEEKEKEKEKRKLRFDVRHVLKRYVRMVRPLLFFKGRRDNIQFRRQPYSFSGNLSFKGSKQELVRGRRGEYSAPASMRTSPTNSGLLVATATLPSSASDSTMEELQAAIQAAIAHCKNSIAVDSRNSNAKIN